MLTISYIKDFAAMHANIAYIILFLGMVAEGEIVVITAGIFAHLGSVNVIISFLVIVLGGGVKTFIGYGFGSYLQKKHSHSPLLIKMENRVNRFLPHLSDRPFLSIFLSRFLIFGIYWFALIFAGYKRIKKKVFIRAEFSSLVVWTIFMLSLGYFFSYTALSVSRNIRNFVGMILLFFIGFFVLEKIISFFVKLFETDKI